MMRFSKIYLVFLIVISSFCLSAIQVIASDLPPTGWNNLPFGKCGKYTSTKKNESPDLYSVQLSNGANHLVVFKDLFPYIEKKYSGNYKWIKRGDSIVLEIFRKWGNGELWHRAFFKKFKKWDGNDYVCVYKAYHADGNVYRKFNKSEQKAWQWDASTILGLANNVANFIANREDVIVAQKKLQKQSDEKNKFKNETKKKIDHLVKRKQDLRLGKIRISNFTDAILYYSAIDNDSYQSGPPYGGPTKNSQYFFWIGDGLHKSGNYYISWDPSKNKGFAFTNIVEKWGELQANKTVMVVGKYSRNIKISLVNGQTILIPLLSNSYVCGIGCIDMEKHIFVMLHLNKIQNN